MQIASYSNSMLKISRGFLNPLPYALALKLKFLEDSATPPFFVVEVLYSVVFQVIEVNCVRLGVLLLVKLNLLCLEMLVATLFLVFN